MMRHILIILYISFFIISISSNVMADERPVLWKQTADEAERDGYSLVTLDELKAFYESKGPFLIVDTRTEYEFNDGHLPGAVNLEFDLGDRLQLKPGKKSLFLKLLGPDKDGRIIFYCRGFR